MSPKSDPRNEHNSKQDDNNLFNDDFVKKSFKPAQRPDENEELNVGAINQT